MGSIAVQKEGVKEQGGKPVDEEKCKNRYHLILI
jgi:hypothetical protein